jgi:hypothetical protein
LMEHYHSPLRSLAFGQISNSIVKSIHFLDNGY